MAAVAGAAHADDAARVDDAASALAPTIRVAVIDLRADTDDAARAALVGALRDAELVPVGGDLGVALIGRDPDQAMAIRVLAEAQDGFGQLDCGRARPLAEHAAQVLSARTAAGLDERARLTRAWTYVALCAERDGDRSMARFAVERLRGLGDAAGALPPDVWSRYPEIDAATDRDIVELTVTGPAGTTAWVDGRAIGATPATAFVAAGKHVVAVADGRTRTRAATIATALGQPLTVDLQADPVALQGEHAIADTVRGWQTAGAADSTVLATLMQAARVELAVVIGTDGATTLWQVRKREPIAIVVATGAGAALATAAQEAWAVAHDRAPEAGVELLREGDLAGDKADREPTRWWVYAAIGGAIAVGAAVIYAADAGDDRQRFELRF